MEELIKRGDWLGAVKKDSGGQGQVYFAVNESWIDETMQAVSVLAGGRSSEPAHKLAAKMSISKTLFDLLSPEVSARTGALKVLHGFRQGGGFTEKEMTRLRAEVKAMQTIRFPSLLRILDSNVDEGWYVSEYFHAGTLDKHTWRFRGSVSDSLTSFRRLVEGVAQLHMKETVHRDIKPANIFIDSSGGLVLGDFGLIYFQDEERKRVTETLENVGSRYWMPHWAEGMRIDEVRPSIDVYSLGKVLWSMVSGKTRLVREEWNEGSNDVATLFPDNPSMPWVKWLLGKCVLDREENVLKNASELLKFTDMAIDAISIGGQVATEASGTQICAQCGVGRLRTVESSAKVEFYWEPKGYAASLQKVMLKVVKCDRCQHILMFADFPGEGETRVFG